MKQILQVKRLWMIVSWVCFIIGVIFLYRGDLDKAFIAGVIGCLAWFLSYRAQMKELVALADEQSKQDGKSQSDEE
jgi:hypothetical protein